MFYCTISLPYLCGRVAVWGVWATACMLQMEEPDVRDWTHFGNGDDGNGYAMTIRISRIII